MTEHYDTIIIGAGVSGLSAAMYSGRFNMKTLVIGDLPGGVITTTDIVENYPGFKRLTGIELANKIKEHAQEYASVEIKSGTVKEVEKKGEDFIVKTSSETYTGSTIIFATGTKWKKLEKPGEEEFANKGVHYCALCDGYFYKDKVVAVIGGSDSAAKDALVLTQNAKKVYIIYRREKIRPEPINYERVMNNPKIEIINNTNITEILGDTSVKKVKLDNPYNGSDELELEGVFVAIGHIVLSDLAKPLGVELNQKNEIKIDRNAKTNVEGVYAAGDVVDTGFKQAITGVAEGVLASYSAYQHVQSRAEK